MSYQSDPYYNTMMSCFQKGDWTGGFKRLNKLMEKYPLDSGLLSFKKEMQVKADYDSAEQIRAAETKRDRIKSIALRLFVVGIIVVLFVWGFSTYNNWIQIQLSAIQQRIEMQQQEFEKNIAIRNVEQLLASYRPSEAITLLDEVQLKGWEYPDLENQLNRANALLELEDQYAEAIQLEANNDLVAAYGIFQEIETKNPSYRDVILHINEIQRDFSLNDLIELADNAAQQGNWIEAINKYEEVREKDPFFQKDIVDERLYNSYLTAAQQLLDNNPDSLEALQEAQMYYANALSIRPQDVTTKEELAEARSSIGNRLYSKYIQLAQETLAGQKDSLEALQQVDKYLAIALSIYPDSPSIVQERAMAQAYLQGHKEFYNRNWDGVIENLKSIYELEPDYAGGTARQTLYDAYIFRGDFHLRSGKPQLALEDYQSAVSIAELRPDARIRLFESMVKIADTLRILGNHQAAVFQYRAAIDLAGINEIIILNADLIQPVTQAEEYVRQGVWQAASDMYQTAMQEIIKYYVYQTHVVESGDYLSQLANYYNTTTQVILDANNLSDPNDLSIGERIIIPVVP